MPAFVFLFLPLITNPPTIRIGYSKKKKKKTAPAGPSVFICYGTQQFGEVDSRKQIMLLFEQTVLRLLTLSCGF